MGVTRVSDVGVSGPERPAEAILAMRWVPGSAEGKTGPLGAIQGPCLSGGLGRAERTRPMGVCQLIAALRPLDGCVQLRRGE